MCKRLRACSDATAVACASHVSAPMICFALANAEAPVVHVVSGLDGLYCRCACHTEGDLDDLRDQVAKLTLRVYSTPQTTETYADFGAVRTLQALCHDCRPVSAAVPPAVAATLHSM